MVKQQLQPNGDRLGGCFFNKKIGDVAIGRRSGEGRDQEIAPTAVRDGECVAIGRRGRDQEIAPTGKDVP